VIAPEVLCKRGALCLASGAQRLLGSDTSVQQLCLLGSGLAGEI
jgi:hypothetical protein